MDSQHHQYAPVLATIVLPYNEGVVVSGNCVIVIPCVRMDGYLQKTLTMCLELEYDNLHIALLPDHPVTLPSELLRDNVSVLVTGDLTIAEKRNIAIDHFGSADYFAFIDSDAYPEKEWLKNGVAFLDNTPEAWAVGGPNIPPNDEPFHQRVVGNALRSFLVSGPLHFTKTRSTSRKCPSLHTCNLIIPRKTFDVIGGFDKSLFTGEDRNLCDRIRATGKDIWFRQDVVVYHHSRPLWMPLFRQRLTYGYCGLAIARRQKNTANLFLQLPILWLFIFCALATAEAGLSVNMNITVGLTIACLAATAAETARTSGSLMEAPYTFAAIILCYLATTVGQLLALAGCPVSLKPLYAQRARTEEPLP